MSSTTQYTVFSDLYQGLEQRVRLASGVTATDNQAKQYINIALQDIHLGFDYKVPWAERQATLRTNNDYSTGTITATQGSASIVGVGTTWNTASPFAGVNIVRAGGKIVINGSRVPYVIQAVGSDTTATLTTAFTEASVAGGTYMYFEDEYALASDFLRPIDAQQFSDHLSIELISRSEFRRRYPNNSVPGRPTVATILDYAPVGNTTPIRKVRLAQPPNDYLVIPYSYVTANLATSSAGVAQTGLSADTDEPIVPLRYRHAIIFHALYQWYRDKKDDTRSQEAKAEYTDIMTRITLDQEIGAPRPQFRPRVSGYVRAARSPYRTRFGGRYVTGSAFDENR